MYGVYSTKSFNDLHIQNIKKLTVNLDRNYYWNQYNYGVLSSSLMYKLHTEIRKISSVKQNQTVLQLNLNENTHKTVIVDVDKTVSYIKKIFKKEDDRMVNIYHNGLELDNNKKIYDIPKPKSDKLTVKISDSVPMEIRTNEEVKDLALKEFKNNFDILKSQRNDNMIYIRNKMIRLYEERLFADMTIVLDDNGCEIYSTKVSCAIMTSKSDNNCLIELMNKNKSKFISDENLVVSINDPSFIKFNADQLINSLDLVIKFCYTTTITNELDVYVKYADAVLNWSKYFQITILYDIINDLIDGKFITEYCKRSNIT
jgi:hypothetical protein